jgi:hypothetical protein
LILLEQDLWTSSHLIDELYFCLISVKTRQNEALRKYEEQARYLMYRIPIYKPTPAFVIDTNDLTERIMEELSNLNEKSKQDIMKESVGKIFEGIDKRFYLLSVRHLLKCELK